MLQRRNQLRMANFALAACVLLAVVGTLLLWKLQWSDDNDDNETTQPLNTTAEALSDAPGLTLSQLADGETLSLNGRQYSVNRTDSTACRNAAEGEKLLAQLTEEKCARSLRITVLDESSEWIATFGVAEMKNADSAQRVENLLKDPAENHFLLLPPDLPEEPEERAATLRVKVKHNDLGQYVAFYAVARIDGAHIENDNKTMLSILKDLSSHVEDVLEAHAMTA